MHLSHRDQDLARVSLDRATRLSRGVGVDMRRDSNPRFDAETRRLQTEARRVLAARRLENSSGRAGKQSSSKGRKGIRAPENATKRERDVFFDPTAATRARPRRRLRQPHLARLRERPGAGGDGALEAEIGPGRYEPRDDAKAGRRAPEAGASAAARWNSEETNPETNPPNPSETSDVAAAFAAVRPRVAVGGVIPDAGRGIGVSAGNDGDDASQRGPLPPSAVVNLEDALRYLRGERHASAPDFKRAARSGREAKVTSDARARDVSRRRGRRRARGAPRVVRTSFGPRTSVRKNPRAVARPGRPRATCCSCSRVARIRRERALRQRLRLRQDAGARDGRRATDAALTHARRLPPDRALSSKLDGWISGPRC